jgi:hypothetical protein
MPNGNIMSSAISAASTAGHATTIAPPSVQAPTVAKGVPSKAVAQPSAASSAAVTAQQRSALNQMLATYARDQSHGIGGSTLSALGKQIMAAAKVLNQHVTLPHAPAPAGSEATSVPPAVAEKGKVNVTA